MKKENPLRHLPSGQESYGKILIHLDDILKERNISLNQLSFRAEMQRTQLRLCYVLDCDLYELIEYIPPMIEE